jgi:predicted Zn-dependent protease
VLIEWAKSGIEDKYAHRRLIGYSLILIGGVWRVICIPLFWLQADLWNRPVELYLFAEMSRPHQFQLQASAARELMLMGKFNEAKTFANKSHETGPWYPISSMILGYTTLKEGDSHSAETHFREALSKSSPGTAISDFSRLHLADSLQKQGAESSVVREILLPLLKNQHGDYHLDAIRMLIDCYMTHKQQGEALGAARNAVKIHPNNPQFIQILAEIEEKYPEKPTKQ